VILTTCMTTTFMILDDIPEDEELTRWLQELHDSGDMFKVAYGSDSETALQEELRNVKIK